MTQHNSAVDALTVLTMDQSAATPPFRQLHDAVVRGISDGRLLPGQRLPTTRALATHLGLALNTVASAYRALEEAGIVEGRGRAGTFVSLGEDPVTSAARAIALDAAGRIRALGLDAEATRRLLTEAVEAV